MNLELSFCSEETTVMVADRTRQAAAELYMCVCARLSVDACVSVGVSELVLSGRESEKERDSVYVVCLCVRVFGVRFCVFVSSLARALFLFVRPSGWLSHMRTHTERRQRHHQIGRSIESMPCRGATCSVWPALPLSPRPTPSMGTTAALSPSVRTGALAPTG